MSELDANGEQGSSAPESATDPLLPDPLQDFWSDSKSQGAAPISTSPSSGQCSADPTAEQVASYAQIVESLDKQASKKSAPRKTRLSCSETEKVLWEKRIGKRGEPELYVEVVEKGCKTIYRIGGSMVRSTSGSDNEMMGAQASFSLDELGRSASIDAHATMARGDTGDAFTYGRLSGHLPEVGLSASVSLPAENSPSLLPSGSFDAHADIISVEMRIGTEQNHVRGSLGLGAGVAGEVLQGTDLDGDGRPEFGGGLSVPVVPVGGGLRFELPWEQ